MDEHRIGRKPLIRRLWAPIGQRPGARVEHRYRWRALIGFVHLASGSPRAAPSGTSPRGRASALCESVSRLCSDRRGRAAPRQHSVLVLEQAGWHTSARARARARARPSALPAPCAPERQTAEHRWPLPNEARVNAASTPTSAISMRWKTPHARTAPCSNSGGRSSVQPPGSIGGPSASRNVRGRGGISITPQLACG